MNVLKSTDLIKQTKKITMCREVHNDSEVCVFLCPLFYAVLLSKYKHCTTSSCLVVCTYQSMLQASASFPIPCLPLLTCMITFIKLSKLFGKRNVFPSGSNESFCCFNASRTVVELENSKKVRHSHLATTRKRIAFAGGGQGPIFSQA